MTRTTNARVAGFTYLFYIAVAFPGMVLFDRATRGQGIAAKLASITEHATDVRITILLSVLSCFSALVLAVTLYAITRDEDADLALLAMTCRVGEGVVAGIPIVAKLGLIWLVTAAAGANAPDPAAGPALGLFLIKVEGWGTSIAAIFFAVGSTLFSYLLLRGRMVPAPLAWLGVLGSCMVAAALPAQLAGFLRGSVIDLMWIPMIAFEVSLALWLIIKGAATPATR